MARLPTPGSDDGNWGDILNDYLEQAHKEDGTLKDDILTDAAVAPANIDGDAGTPSLRTLGDGAQQAYPGSAGAANAATIAALEESADSGLTTEMANLRVTTSTVANSNPVTAQISIPSYVTVTPDWFSLGTNTFTLNKPGLYVFTGLAYIWGGASNQAILVIGGDQPNDRYSQINYPGYTVDYCNVAITAYVAVYDPAHPDPETGSYVSSGIACVTTTSQISLNFSLHFSGGGTRYGGMNPLTITRVQSNPITL
jgi:hypothetical protein